MLMYGSMHTSKYCNACSQIPSLIIDAYDCANRLVMVNDYRKDILNENSKLNSRKMINAEWVSVYLSGWPYMILVAKKPIKAGSELLSDYGKEYWQSFRTAEVVYGPALQALKEAEALFKRTLAKTTDLT